MRILLKKGRKEIEFLDGTTTLNANDEMWQVMNITVEDPLSVRETLWIVYKKADNDFSVSHEILVKESETNVYEQKIPTEVIKIAGDWTFQIFVRECSTTKSAFISRSASNVTDFYVEQGLPIDEEGAPVNALTIAAMYAQAMESVSTATEQATAAQTSAAEATAAKEAAEGVLENVVKKSGDTMTGPLNVESAGYITSIESGNIALLDTSEDLHKATQLNANGSIARVKNGRVFFQNLPDESGTLARVEDIEEKINEIKGQAGGFAPLDNAAKVPAQYLPSYVDDVIDFEKSVSGSDWLKDTLDTSLGVIVFNNTAASNLDGGTASIYYKKFLQNTDGTKEGLIIIEPVGGKIYNNTSSNLMYRWSGSNLVEISKSIGLGETSSTAYPGNKGKANAINIAAIQATLLNKADLKDGKIPAEQLPSYMDDIVNGYMEIDTENPLVKTFYATNQDTGETEAITPVTGVIYVDINTGLSYRWSGREFIDLPNFSEYYTKTEADDNFSQNLEIGPAKGSVQQKGWTDGETEYLGAKATGEGSVAVGGQRYDKVGEDLAEEPQTEAKGKQSFATGGGVIVDGDWSAGFGKDAKTYQRACFAAGGGTQAGMTYEEWLAVNSYEDNETNLAAYKKDYGFAAAFGDSSKALGRAAFVAGTSNVASGKDSFVTGAANTASGVGASAVGGANTASGDFAVAEGYKTNAQGEGSHTEGSGTEAAGGRAHAEGENSKALGDVAHAEGRKTIASGGCSHTQGWNTQATGNYASAEGAHTIAGGECSHAEGDGSVANGQASHAEGFGTEASGVGAHAEGQYTEASGVGAHAQGRYTKAVGDDSFATGYNTIAGKVMQSVMGSYNDNKENTLLEVGNGTIENRSNALEVYSDGRTKVYGEPIEDEDVVRQKELNAHKGTKLYKHLVTAHANPDDPDAPLTTHVIISTRAEEYTSHDQIFIDWSACKIIRMWEGYSQCNVLDMDSSTYYVTMGGLIESVTITPQWVFIGDSITTI